MWEFLVGREQAKFLRPLASGQEEEGQEAQMLSHPTPPRKGAQAAQQIEEYLRVGWRASKVQQDGQ